MDSETIDMDGEMPKAIWAFNGTERPGAVYLASALASHTQKDCHFALYGRDVARGDQYGDTGRGTGKIVALCPCRYSCGYNEGEILSFNRQCIHGHYGSIPNPDFFQEYLGMRNEYVDASEIERRVQLVFMTMKSSHVPWHGQKSIARVMKGQTLIRNIWYIPVKRKMPVGNTW